MTAGDSQLIIKQVQGVYKVKHEDMKRLHSDVSELLKRIPHVSLEYIPRAQNARADELSNFAMDTRQNVSVVRPAVDATVDAVVRRESVFEIRIDRASVAEAAPAAVSTPLLPPPLEGAVKPKEKKPKKEMQIKQAIVIDEAPLDSPDVTCAAEAGQATDAPIKVKKVKKAINLKDPPPMKVITMVKMVKEVSVEEVKIKAVKQKVTKPKKITVEKEKVVAKEKAVMPKKVKIAEGGADTSAPVKARKKKAAVEGGALSEGGGATGAKGSKKKTMELAL